MNRKEWIDRIIASRTCVQRSSLTAPYRKMESEGGCGVIGLACNEKIAGRHLLPPLKQMCNRGNGKGGGIAAAGLDPKEMGVSEEILQKDYLLGVAYLDPNARSLVEKEHINAFFEVDHIHLVPRRSSRLHHAGVETLPPEVILYFVRVKKKIVEDFRNEHSLFSGSVSDIEDECVYQISNRLNNACYNATGEKKAFILSRGKNLLVLKMVAYGDDVISCYELEDVHAHVWIGHHRYPTKGTVWHPGGAHPFVGLNEALVHNGDFANYSSMAEYLAQRNIYPHFLTDTEVGVLVFDLLTRTYKYPLEYAIECLAPTTERDFALLPLDKQSIYQSLQKSHIHGSPDGPWFFLIAQSHTSPKPLYRLIGITDTSMLRPQVFALQEGDVSIGFAASEKQAIDAALESLSTEDHRFWSHADLYWNARGGSHTDGGAFLFTVVPQEDGSLKLVCTDKFGTPICLPRKEIKDEESVSGSMPSLRHIPKLSAKELFQWVRSEIQGWNEENLLAFLKAMEKECRSDEIRKRAIASLTLLMDQRYPTGSIRRSRLVAFLHSTLSGIVEGIRKSPSPLYTFIQNNNEIHAPMNEHQTAVIDAREYSGEGENSLARKIVSLVRAGFNKLLIANCRGHRFIANGLGRDSRGVRIDVYGSSGDYLASGIDGAHVYVHGNAQDQVGQIMKDGLLVIFGDVGQTFFYAAKGGTAYILGNAAGRPLINAVGVPRVIINGTCLDYLAESFMAGNPLDKGGFVVINAVKVDDDGNVIELEDPYPGSNLFSLPSGGAIYIRDPEKKVSKNQLNGGVFTTFSNRDWEVVQPYLKENEKHFNIPLSRLLEHKGRKLLPDQIYRKIHPAKVKVLEPEEAWVTNPQLPQATR